MKTDVRNFFDLDVWKSARDLAIKIYTSTKEFPSDERFGLTDQLRRASNSVMANIAEGFARFHYNDKIKFYYHSRGSVAEVQSHLFLAESLGYIDHDSFEKLSEQTEEIGRLLNGLINSINNQKNI